MKPVVLMILDGWGINEEYDKGNAIKQAQMDGALMKNMIRVMLLNRLKLPISMS